jgi:hypothetical protein
MLTLKKPKASKLSKLSKSLKWVTRGAYFSLSHKLVTRAIFGLLTLANGQDTRQQAPAFALTDQFGHEQSNQTVRNQSVYR